MSSKPIIALNADYRGAKKDAPAFSYVQAGYFDAITRAGGVPMVLPPYEDVEDLNRILGLVDGVLLIGGADLDPRRDGFMMHPSVRTLDARREEFDRMLVRVVARRRIPVYGIGVGMQLLNVSQGGNLFLHIPEDLPRPHATQRSLGSGAPPRVGRGAGVADGTHLWRG